MGEETPESPVSSRGFQIETLSFLDKIKIHKFKILGGILGFFVAAGLVFAGYEIGRKQVQLTPISIPTVIPTPISKFTPTPKISPTSVIPATPELTPTPDPTADWKTYTNARYGYEIKYPPDYKLASCRSCFDLSLVDFVTFNPPSSVGYGVIVVSSLKIKEENLTADEYLEEISGIDANPLVPGSKKRFQLNGLEALTTITQSFGYENKNFFLLKEDRGFHISFSGVASPANKGIALGDYRNLTVFDLMLSTFRFLE